MEKEILKTRRANITQHTKLNVDTTYQIVVANRAEDGLRSYVIYPQKRTQGDRNLRTRRAVNYTKSHETSTVSEVFILNSTANNFT